MLNIQPNSARLWLSSLITLVIELTALWCFVNFNRLGCEPEETTKTCPKPVNDKPTSNHSDSPLPDLRWRRPQMAPATAFNMHGATATRTVVEEEISALSARSEPEEITSPKTTVVKKRTVRSVENIEVAARNSAAFQQNKPLIKQEVQSVVKTTTDQIGRFARSLLGSKHSKVHE